MIVVNPLRGEIELVVGTGDEAKTYTLRLQANAMVEAETVTGLGMGEIIAKMQQAPAIGLLRGLLWAAMREYQPKATLADAGEIISIIGIPKAGDVLGDALKWALPDADTSGPSPVATQG